MPKRTTIAVLSRRLSIERHQRLIARVRHVSEGIIKAVADEASRQRAPKTVYGAGGTTYGRLLMRQLRRLGWFKPKPKVIRAPKEQLATVELPGQRVAGRKKTTHNAAQKLDDLFSSTKKFERPQEIKETDVNVNELFSGTEK